jgi:putative inorganic carbon (HCO3(-)) transporter
MRRAEAGLAFHALALSTAIALSSAAAYGVVRNPELLHVQVSARTLAALMAAIMGAALLLWKPGNGVMVLVALVYLNVSELLVRFHALPSLLQVIAIPLLIAAWVGGGSARLREALSPTPLTLASLAYVLVLLASTTYSRDGELADGRVLEYVKALSVFFLVAALAWSPALVRRAGWTLIACGALLGAIALFQTVTGSYDNTFAGLGRVKYAQIYGNVFRPRVAGPFGDPNFFAQIGVPVVAVGLSVAAHATRRGPRLAALFGALLAAAGVVFSYSRGGMLAIAVVVVLTVIAARIPLRRLLPAAALVAGLIIAMNPSGMMRRLSTIREFLPGESEAIDPDSSFGERALLMRTAWLIFLDHPLTGVGVGNYTAHFDDYADQTGSAFRQYDGVGDRRYPHNLFLEIAAETGLLGVGMFAATLLACFAALRRARRIYEAVGEIALVGLSRGVQVGLAGYLVTALFLHGQFPRHLWLVFGLALALERLATRTAADSDLRETPQHGSMTDPLPVHA